MTDNNELRIVICSRVADSSPGLVTPGSTRGVCHACGAAVVVARSTRQLITDRPDIAYIFNCTPCGFASMREEREKGEEVNLEQVPGQAEEIYKALLQIARARSN